MATRAIEAGPVAKRVAENVARLRTARGLTVRALSARLGELGRPLLPSAVTKVEQGERRVDVDDLAAFAVALGVNPSALLLPPQAGDEPVPLTTRLTRPSWAVWQWADGANPLPSRGDDEPDREWNTDAEVEDFQLFARPPDLRRRAQHPAMRAAASLLGRVTRLVTLADDQPAGDPGHEARLRGARLALRRVADEIDEIEEQLRG